MYVSSVFLLLGVCCLQTKADGSYRGRGYAHKIPAGTYAGKISSGSGTFSGGMTSGGGGGTSGGMASGGIEETSGGMASGGSRSTSGGMTSGGTESISGGMTSIGTEETSGGMTSIGTEETSGGMASVGTGSASVGMETVGSGSASGGSIPGGIGECLAIVPFHRQLAYFALKEMGSGYILREILGVRTNVVAGIMYHMELYVATTLTSVIKCKHCDVKVIHQPWMPKKMTLHRYDCRDTCCRGRGKHVDKLYK